MHIAKHLVAGRNDIPPCPSEEGAKQDTDGCTCQRLTAAMGETGDRQKQQQCHRYDDAERTDGFTVLNRERGRRYRLCRRRRRHRRGVGDDDRRQEARQREPEARHNGIGSGAQWNHATGPQHIVAGLGAPSDHLIEAVLKNTDDAGQQNGTDRCQNPWHVGGGDSTDRHRGADRQRKIAHRAFKQIFDCRHRHPLLCGLIFRTDVDSAAVINAVAQKRYTPEIGGTAIGCVSDDNRAQIAESDTERQTRGGTEERFTSGRIAVCQGDDHQNGSDHARCDECRARSHAGLNLLLVELRQRCSVAGEETDSGHVDRRCQRMPQMFGALVEQVVPALPDEAAGAGI